jgi:hypothetical protein
MELREERSAERGETRSQRLSKMLLDKSLDF